MIDSCLSNAKSVILVKATEYLSIFTDHLQWSLLELFFAQVLFFLSKSSTRYFTVRFAICDYLLSWFFFLVDYCWCREMLLIFLGQSRIPQPCWTLVLGLLSSLTNLLGFLCVITLIANNDGQLFPCSSSPTYFFISAYDTGQDLQSCDDGHPYLISDLKGRGYPLAMFAGFVI